MHAAVVGEFSSILENVTERVAFAQALVRIDRAAVGTRIERVIGCSYGMGLIPYLGPIDLGTLLDRDGHGLEVGIDDLDRNGPAGIRFVDDS